jgi:hypothetical protein
VDKEVSRKITLVAVGGTAMTLLDLKPSTIDIDFTVPSGDKLELDKALKSVPHGYKVDVWIDGTVFCTTLPDDYLDRSRDIISFKHITLKALHPVDIIVTKIGRLDARDMQDIAACIKKFQLSKKEIETRAASVTYAPNEEDYRYNLKLALKEFFR